MVKKLKSKMKLPKTKVNEKKHRRKPRQKPLLSCNLHYFNTLKDSRFVELYL